MPRSKDYEIALLLGDCTAAEIAAACAARPQWRRAILDYAADYWALFGDETPLPEEMPEDRAHWDAIVDRMLDRWMSPPGSPRSCQPVRLARW